MQLALQTALKAREKSDLASGMKAEGAFVCMVVPEGGSATTPFMLQPGRCYTFIGQSFPNVGELDVAVKPNLGTVAVPLLAAVANAPLFVDSDVGPAATVGKGSQCVKNPSPIPFSVLLEAKARTGAGPIAVQIYSK